MKVCHGRPHEALGTVFLCGVPWTIGEAVSGEEIALREAAEGRVEVYDCGGRG